MFSEGLWKRRFGGAQNVVGMTLRLDDRVLRIVGVLSHEFGYDRIEGIGKADLWVPRVYRAGEEPKARYLTVIARLGRGITPAAATAELDALVARDAKTGQPRAADVWRCRAVFSRGRYPRREV